MMDIKEIHNRVCGLSHEHETIFKQIIEQSNEPIRARQIIINSLTEIASNELMYQSTKESIINAIKRAVNLDLMPKIGFNLITFVPFRNNDIGRIELNVMIGYQGLITLITRDRPDISIHTDCIYQNEKFEILGGSNPEIKHRLDITGKREKPIAYYAVASVGKNTIKPYAIMTKMEMDQHKAKYAKKRKDGQPGIWDINYHAMAIKTVIKKLIKILPIGDATHKALKQEQNQYKKNKNKEPTIKENQNQGNKIDKTKPDQDQIPDQDQEKIDKKT